MRTGVCATPTDASRWQRYVQDGGPVWRCVGLALEPMGEVQFGGSIHTSRDWGRDERLQAASKKS